MDDLLKEAIADAKAVRETALQNAKMALEEAFTPRLKSMLSKKIQSEDGYDMETEDDEMEDEEEMEVEPEVEPDEIPEEEGEEEADVDMDMGDEEEDEEEAPAEGYDESDIIEIDGVKYAPIVSEDDEEEAPEEEEEEPADEEEPDMEESDELDLEAILRELEEEADEDGDEVSESDEEGDSDKVEEAEETEDAETVDEAEETETVDEAEKAEDTEKVEEAEKTEDAETVDEAEETDESEEVSEEVEEVEEEIDLEEILNALREDDGSDSEADLVEASTRIAHLEKEVTEHRDVVKILRSKLNEVNLLNSKLLFTNKLFRAFGLSNNQKMKVVETFDRAKSLREVKLVYSTLAETFGSKAKEIKESKRVKGTASKPVASTKSDKQEIITEADEMKARFKKLANIL